MIEYLYNIIRMTCGSDETIAAILKDGNGLTIRDQCNLKIFDNGVEVIDIYGTLVNNVWNFTIPAAVNCSMKRGHRYTYCIYANGNCALCFPQPIYFI
jgi:hypothetical protein